MKKSSCVFILLSLVTVVACHEQSSPGLGEKPRSASPSVGSEPVAPPAAMPEEVANENNESVTSVTLSNQNLRAKDGLIYGPIERSVLRDGAINVAIDKTLAGNNFDEFMNMFERESASNQTAQESTKIYGAEITRTLSELTGSGMPTRFACGSNVCMGYIRSEAGSDWFSNWYGTFAEKSRAPLKAMTFQDVPLNGGGTEHRFLFSTAGEGGIYVPAGK